MISYVEIGKYIIAFVRTLDNRKTRVYELCNSQNEKIHLGEIKYNTGWRKYCFYPRDETVFDSKCLMDIVRFVDSLNTKRKRETVIINKKEMIEKIKQYKDTISS